ncbi:hypothetical protein IWX83_000961 [Flavobacterium sp. CG_9.1]|uniref:hypothetical protein n=1 Tax=Flavobacterium sp. CG_9.1 TaxID=2787728 RepID=UPI0018CBD361|nr:hypothetical protein [Flavobacterium sp. CG_9.1]MBG6061185.1 hypothetical protein [Flavobacterium sp. CG_9.1]
MVLLACLALEREREAQKNFTFKIHGFSKLKIKLRKGQKKCLKKLEYRYKGVSFAPATTANVHLNTGKQHELN